MAQKILGIGAFALFLSVVLVGEPSRAAPDGAAGIRKEVKYSPLQGATGVQYGISVPQTAYLADELRLYRSGEWFYIQDVSARIALHLFVKEERSNSPPAGIPKESTLNIQHLRSTIRADS